MSVYYEVCNKRRKMLFYSILHRASIEILPIPQAISSLVPPLHNKTFFEGFSRQLLLLYEIEISYDFVFFNGIQKSVLKPVTSSII